MCVTLHILRVCNKLDLTFVIQLSSVLCEALEAHPLAKQIQELIQCWSSTLVVVHLLLCALTCLAVKNPHLVLEA